MKRIILISVIGLIASIFSFIYFYKCNYNLNILILINIIDILLLLFNVFIIGKMLEWNGIRLFVNVILLTLIYFCLFIAVGLYLFEDSININNVINVLEFSIFLGPVLIILLPIYYLIALVLS